MFVHDDFLALENATSKMQSRCAIWCCSIANLQLMEIGGVRVYV